MNEEIPCSRCCKVEPLVNEWKFSHWASNVLIHWLKIQSLNKEFTLQHRDQGISSFIQWFFIKSVPHSWFYKTSRFVPDRLCGGFFQIWGPCPKLATIGQGTVHERLWYPFQAALPGLWAFSCTGGGIPPGPTQFLCLRNIWHISSWSFPAGAV